MSYTNALTLFREGKDTAEIAAVLGCSEATAYNQLHHLREQERQSVKWPTSRVRYAGAGK